MSQELLSLSTLVERQTIKIESKLHPDGRFYDLRNVDELSVVELQTVMSRQKQVERMQAKPADRVTAADAAHLVERLNELVHLVAPTVEQDVLDELTDGQKAAIIETWTRMATEGGGGDAADPPDGPLTGAA